MFWKGLAKYKGFNFFWFKNREEFYELESEAHQRNQIKNCMICYYLVERGVIWKVQGWLGEDCLHSEE